MTYKETSPAVAVGPDVQISACPQGGHVMSWVAAGVDRLWMSPLSRCGDAGALRGGVPILFPQFGTFGPIGKHGFARTSYWHRLRVEARADAAVLAYRLHDSKASRAIWPHPFELTVEVVATSHWLEQTMTVTNNDDYEASFTCGLHNYLRVSDPHAQVKGLAGHRAWDAVAFPGRPEHLTEVLDEPMLTSIERDLVVHDVTGTVTLDDELLGALEISAEGFADRVVWNPGPNHTLPDVRPGDAASFVCIEPANVTPVRLDAGASWVGRQRIVLPG